MTRRQVYFWDKSTGKFYVSPEFNGDKSELLKVGSADSCDKDWEDFMYDLRHTSSLFDFMRVIHMIYGSYHSSIGDLPGPRIRIFTSRNQIAPCDETYYIVAGEEGINLDEKLSN